ncbi:exonuclease domain-containing protein [Haliea sp. E1-2-M8]|uniref:exonuclease domain-containing protein n=1 Tax=Haliea sp. E1-2-M8 TaxID=3064706 RepID=UPI002723C840|nr:exonuclease domain-containing protein [Haliea sp. E1-2-M8]MDO8864195.1 exonuclease domain-containing protein [Haliea sp. E1-2-M8]
MNQYEYESNFTAVDIELANSSLASICEVGIARFRAGELVETWRVLVNPEVEYEELYHSKLHGIKAHHTADAATFPAIHPVLRYFFSGEQCVYHADSRFDPNCISQSCSRYGLEDVTELASWVSTLECARDLWRDSPSYKLENLCKEIGHDYLPHNALEDAIAAAALYRAISAVVPTPGIYAAGTASGRPRTFRRVPSKKRESGLRGDSSGRFAGTHIVVTGEFAPPWDDRKAFEAYLCTLGFTPRAAITGRTQILVTGSGAGPKKIEKARECGVRIVPEAEFLAFIEE